jgi:hypothetical protein
VYGVGCRVQRESAGFRVCGKELRAGFVGYRASGLRFRIYNGAQGLGFRVSGLGFSTGCKL